MSVNNSDIDKLAEEFKKCQQVLSALGDESRQHLILEMMQMENCDGVRVGEITERTHLSRPAVSHHIRILKQTGILKVRREGTKNYYYFDVDMESLDRLAQMIDSHQGSDALFAGARWDKPNRRYRIMTNMEVIKARHSVRQYLDHPLRPGEIANLTEEVRICNQESGLHIQLVTNEPKAFNGFMAHYGKFSGVQNYFALVGKAGSDLQEKCGYWGERLVLKAQAMGLNTCWVALTFTKVKSAFTLESGEKLAAVIALGHGTSQGVPHKSKSMEEVARIEGSMPDWFRVGMEAALLAPTAMNQQKFLFTLKGGQVSVSAQATGGFYSKIDLGIVKYHFEVGAGKENFQWE